MRALWLRVYAHEHEYNVGESVCEATASSAWVVSFALPACVVAGWVARSSESASLFDAFQAFLFAIPMLLPTLALQNRSD
ncbi:hypothetical protein DM02DRAFT_619519, partial [Periconia macrospinosa]